ncbi:MAG: ArsR/SmtB family transcription factor [Thermomicrobiales bacterium]
MVTYYAGMDEEGIFRGLSDSHRRWILDALFERDGQSLGEICTLFPEMSRFGVMKHLGVLEEAGLIATRREGRTKLHYLNPVPIVWIHDRWISKYAEPWARGLGRLKFALEEKPMSAPMHVYKTYIRTTPEKLWGAITDPAQTQQFFFSTRITSSWALNAPIEYVNDDGSTAVKGTVLEVDPPRKLVHSFKEYHGDSDPNDRASRVTWEIEPSGELCILTLVHDDFDSETVTYRNVGGGWPMVLSNLKTLLETGTAFPM